jgi:hypothetical protein
MQVNLSSPRLVGMLERLSPASRYLARWNDDVHALLPRHLPCSCPPQVEVRKRREGGRGRGRGRGGGRGGGRWVCKGEKECGQGGCCRHLSSKSKSVQMRSGKVRDFWEGVGTCSAAEFRFGSGGGFNLDDCDGSAPESEGCARSPSPRQPLSSQLGKKSVHTFSISFTARGQRQWTKDMRPPPNVHCFNHPPVPTQPHPSPENDETP